MVFRRDEFGKCSHGSGVVSRALLYISLAVFALALVSQEPAHAFDRSGVVLLTNGEKIRFTKIYFKYIANLKTGVIVKEIDNIKTIKFLDPGLKYNGTKGNCGVMQLVLFDGKQLMWQVSMLKGPDHNDYVGLRAKNPVTGKYERRGIETKRIRRIEFRRDRKNYNDVTSSYNKDVRGVKLGTSLAEFIDRFDVMKTSRSRGASFKEGTVATYYTKNPVIDGGHMVGRFTTSANHLFMLQFRYYFDRHPDYQAILNKARQKWGRPDFTCVKKNRYGHKFRSAYWGYSGCNSPEPTTRESTSIQEAPKNTKSESDNMGPRTVLINLVDGSIYKSLKGYHGKPYAVPGIGVVQRGPISKALRKEFVSKFTGFGKGLGYCVIKDGSYVIFQTPDDYSVIYGYTLERYTFAGSSPKKGFYYIKSVNLRMPEKEDTNIVQIRGSKTNIYVFGTDGGYVGMSDYKRGTEQDAEKFLKLVKEYSRKCSEKDRRIIAPYIAEVKNAMF